MFLAMVGFLVFSVSFLLFFLGIYEVDSFGVGSTLFMSVVCLLVSLRGTLREAYYFDRTTDSYAFVRHFIYRKEVIEGSSSQFRCVRVHMIDEEGRKRTVRYVVNLLCTRPTVGWAGHSTQRAPWQGADSALTDVRACAVMSIVFPKPRTKTQISRYFGESLLRFHPMNTAHDAVCRCRGFEDFQGGHFRERAKARPGRPSSLR